MTTLAQTIQKMELSSQVSNLHQIEQLIDCIYDKHHITEDNYGNILIALTEAVNNAIVHGNQQDPNKKVNLVLETSKKDVCFLVKDEGKGFDFDHVPDPTLPENLHKLHGRGVFLMKSLADDVAFEENGSLVRLTFSISNT